MEQLIFFCGYGNRDLLVRLPALPAVGDRVHAESIKPLDGGMAANAAVAAARFGARTLFVGSVGRDVESEAFLGALHAEDISTEHTSRDGFLSHAIILVDALGERAVISQDDSLEIQTLKDVLARIDPHEGHWVYIDGYRWGSDWLPEPGALNIVVDVDGAKDKEQILRAARASRHLLGSRKTFMDTCGFTEAELEELAGSLGITIVVTRGADGLTLLEPGCEPWHAPAFPAEVVDDTGAGDCFAGVYIAALSAGSSSRDAALAGSGAASLSCRSSGARAAPRAHEVHALLETAGTP